MYPNFFFCFFFVFFTAEKRIGSRERVFRDTVPDDLPLLESERT